MPRANPFDKKTSTTYALVSRPQNDTLIHDDSVSSQVFQEVAGPSKSAGKSKVKQRGDLEEEFGFSGALRDNEGEAAEHGVYYDDTSYDYMQHMRDIGDGETGVTTWVEAPQTKQKGKQKQKLEDAMRELTVSERTKEDRLDEDVQSATNGFHHHASYQEQQDIPDSIAGFQPEMDPRLREVLEALEDEAYVDDEDDTFAELTGDAHEVDEEDWQASGAYDDDGWESDDTTKPVMEHKLPGSETMDMPVAEIAQASDGAFLESFTKQKATHSQPQEPTLSSQDPLAAQLPWPPIALSDLASNTSVLTAGRRKKRKGALTSSTGFSMTSSALARTEPLTTLDARFDKIADSYLDDIGEDEDEIDLGDDMSLASGVTTNSRASMAKSMKSAYSMASGRSLATSRDADEGPPRLASAGFQAVMDDFLGPNRNSKERRMKKGGKVGVTGGQSGLEQLDEIRKGLGPARVQSRQAAA